MHTVIYLGRNYRNEYVAKNTIINNILLGRHSVNTATMLNELKVAGSNCRYGHHQRDLYGL